MNYDEFPQQLVSNREKIECNFIFCLYKDSTLIDDYRNVENTVDIITPDGIFYYGIAQNLERTGHKVFDNITIDTYLTNKEALKKGYEERGGYRTIQELTSLIDADNIDGYYAELVKSNLLLNLHSEGFPVMKHLDKFQEMNYEEIYDFLDHKLASTTSNKIEKVNGISLSHGYKEFLDELSNGEQIGYRINSAMLNSRLLGVHKGHLMLYMAHSGKGKTTTALLQFVLPTIKEGQNVLIIANEQSEKEFRLMILPMVLYNEIGYRKISRKQITKGQYTEEQRQKLDEAAAWLADESRGNVEFLKMDNYEIYKAKKKIKEYSKLGYGLVLFDTFKPEKENSDKAWAEFCEAAKILHRICEKENMGFIATAQLTPSSVTQYFLSENDIGKGKGIVETASQLVQFRFLFNDEKEKLRPYTFRQDSDGRYTSVKDYHDLDCDKNYIVYFIPKNRFGETDTQIVCEYNPSFITMKDIGWVNISPNGTRIR